MQEGKCLSDEALQTAEERRSEKQERERYTHLNAEFQRTKERQEGLLQRTAQRNRKITERIRLEISSRKLEISK